MTCPRFHESHAVIIILTIFFIQYIKCDFLFLTKSLACLQWDKLNFSGMIVNLNVSDTRLAICFSFHFSIESDDAGKLQGKEKSLVCLHFVK